MQNNPFEKILLATDHSTASIAAIQRSCDLSLKFGSTIDALFVSGKKESSFDDAKNFLAGYASSKGIQLRVIEKTGNLKEEALLQLNSENYALLIVGSSSEDAQVSPRINSVFKLVKSCICPVIVCIESADSDATKEILLPISDSPKTRQKVVYSAELASAFGSTVHIYGVSASKSSESRNNIESYIRQAERYMSERRIKYSVDSNYGTNTAQSVLAYSVHISADIILCMVKDEKSSLLSRPLFEGLISKSVVPTLCINTEDSKLDEALGY